MQFLLFLMHYARRYAFLGFCCLFVLGALTTSCATSPPNEIVLQGHPDCDPIRVFKDPQLQFVDLRTQTDKNLQEGKLGQVHFLYLQDSSLQPSKQEGAFAQPFQQGADTRVPEWGCLVTRWQSTHTEPDALKDAQERRSKQNYYTRIRIESDGSLRMFSNEATAPTKAIHVKLPPDLKNVKDIYADLYVIRKEKLRTDPTKDFSPANMNMSTLQNLCNLIDKNPNYNCYTNQRDCHFFMRFYLQSASDKPTPAQFLQEPDADFSQHSDGKPRLCRLCHPEICNGKDDDCDGQIDNIPGQPKSKIYVPCYSDKTKEDFSVVFRSNLSNYGQCKPAQSICRTQGCPDDASACFDACPPQQTPPEGKLCDLCGETPGRTTICGELCVDTDTDNKHCGQCDKQCAPGLRCSQGVCLTNCAT
ncbi:MAG: hypothetical protein AAGJ35_10945, partial [Myxococcota bacterium]